MASEVSLDAEIAAASSIPKEAFKVTNSLQSILTNIFEKSPVRERLHLGQTELIDCFQVTAGLFYGIAVISVVVRGAIRVITRRKFALDDYFLFVAFAFLTAVTGLIYYLLDGIYVSTAVESNPVLIFRISSAQVNLILNQALNENIFLALAWTTTFLVKFSFLAFFRQLIRNVNNIKYYYWSVVALTVVTWMSLTSEAFILCSDFGIEAGELSSLVVD